MSTDIRVGDLIKATKGEQVVIGRVEFCRPDSTYLDIQDFATLDVKAEWDIEVLDRPLPPIDEELVRGACEAYRAGKADFGHNIENNGAAIKAVINYLRQHDTYNKESK